MSRTDHKIGVLLCPQPLEGRSEIHCVWCWWPHMVTLWICLDRLGESSAMTRRDIYFGKSETGD